MKPPHMFWWPSSDHLVAGDGLHVGGEEAGVHGVGQKQAQVRPGCGQGTVPMCCLPRKILKKRRFETPHVQDAPW